MLACRRPGRVTTDVRPHLLVREQVVAIDIERAFAFYADALNLEAITPPWLRFHVRTPEPIAMRPGARIEYRLRLHGVPVRWETEITAWEPGRRFVDTQVRGPYRVWVHEHTFEPRGGATLIRDRVRYRLPLGPLGALAHLAFVRRDLERIFDFRNQEIGRRLAGEALTRGDDVPPLSSTRPRGRVGRWLRRRGARARRGR